VGAIKNALAEVMPAFSDPLLRSNEASGRQPERDEETGVQINRRSWRLVFLDRFEEQ
jgi:hypothetical protein